MRSLFGLALVLLACLLSGAAQAADKSWTGAGPSGDNAWTTAANWSDNSVPSNSGGDTVTFSGASSKPCVIDTNVNVAGFTIASGYTGTITQASGKTVTVGSTGFSQADGTFAGGDSAISITGPVAFSGGSFTATSGTLTAQSAWTVSGTPTFSANGGTVAFAVLYATTQTITPGSSAFKNVTITGFGSYSTQTISGTLVVGGALVFNINSYSGNLLNGGVIQALGDIAMNDAGFATGTWGPGSATLQIAGTGAQTLAGATSGHFPNVEVAKPSGTLTVTGSPVIVGNWTWTSGDAYFGSSTMVFATPYGGSQTITPGTVKYNNVSIKGFGQYGAQTIDGTLSVGGDLTLGVTDYSGNRLDGGVIQVEGSVAMGSSGFGTLNPGPGSVTIQFTGTGAQTLSSPAAGYFPSIEVAKPSGTLTVTDSPLVVGNWTYTSGTVDFGTSNLILACAYNGTQSITPGDITYGNVTIRGHGQGSVQTVNGTMTVGGALTFGTSGFGGNHLNGGTISALSDVTMTSSDFGGGVDGAGSATVVLAGIGNQTLTGSDTGRLPNVVVQKDTGTLTMSGAIYVAGNWNHVSGAVSASGSSTTFAGGINSQISGNAVFGSLTAAKAVWQTGVTINDSITVVNDLQLTSNSLSIPNLTTVSVGGNVALGASGTSFSAPHSTIVLNGAAAQSVDFGTTTIHSLTVANTTAPVTFASGVTTDFYSTVTFAPGSSVKFTPGETYAFDNLVANGTAALPITFASVTTGQTWALKLPLRYAVYHVSVTDSDASSGAPVTAITSTNGGNNSNWNFGTPAALAITTPNSSITSPAWVEGTCGVDVTSVQASINGGMAFDAVRLSASSWFPDNASAGGASLGINLNPSSVTAFSITATSATGDTNTATQSITWTPTNLTGQSVSTVLKLRKGDSLLLTATGAGTVLTIDANGDSAADYAGTPGDQFAFQYNTPGSFTAEAKIDGVSVGTVAIQVVDVDTHSPVACEIGYARKKNLTVTPVSMLPDLTFLTNDPFLLSVSTDSVIADGIRLTLLTLHRGSPVLVIRTQITGAVLTIRSIDEFTIQMPTQSFLIDAGSGEGGAVLVMQPYIPNLRFDFSMYAHTSTFSDGQPSYSVNSSDLDPNSGKPFFSQSPNPETVDLDGVYSIPFESPPTETSACLQVNIFQSGSPIEIIGTHNGNPVKCLIDVRGGVFVLQEYNNERDPNLAFNEQMNQADYAKERWFALQTTNNAGADCRFRLQVEDQTHNPSGYLIKDTNPAVILPYYNPFVFLDYDKTGRSDPYGSVNNPKSFWLYEEDATAHIPVHQVNMWPIWERGCYSMPPGMKAWDGHPTYSLSNVGTIAKYLNDNPTDTLRLGTGTYTSGYDLAVYNCTGMQMSEIRHLKNFFSIVRADAYGINPNLTPNSTDDQFAFPNCLVNLHTGVPAIAGLKPSLASIGTPFKVGVRGLIGGTLHLRAFAATQNMTQTTHVFVSTLPEVATDGTEEPTIENLRKRFEQQPTSNGYATFDVSSTATTTNDSNIETTLYLHALSPSDAPDDITIIVQAEETKYVVQGSTLADSSDDWVVADTETTTAIQLDVNVFKVNSGDSNSATTELEEEKEEFPGAYIPLNDDDDDYDQNNLPDKDETGPIQDERDLLKIVLHKSKPDIGGNYSLEIPANLRVWKNNNRSDPVSAQDTFSASEDTYLYLEGVLPNDGTLSLDWTDGTNTYNDCDRVHISCFALEGPLNVPGYTNYKYIVLNGPSSGSFSDTVVGGAISGFTDLSSTHILWNSGPTVGDFRYDADNDFMWHRKVNVVQVSIDVANSNVTFTTGITLNGPRIIANSGSVCVDGTIGISQIQGPTVNNQQRGVKFIEVGLNHQAKFDNLETVYHETVNNQTTAYIKRGSLCDDHFHWDPEIAAALPWIYNDASTNGDVVEGRSYFHQTVDGAVGPHPLSFDDNPNIPVDDPNDPPNLFVVKPPITVNNTYADHILLVMEHKNFLSVSTTDSGELHVFAEHKLTQRASLHWVVNGSVSLYWSFDGQGNAIYPPSYIADDAANGVHGDGPGSQKFIEVTDGSALPGKDPENDDAIRSTINGTLDSQHWETVIP